MKKQILILVLTLASMPLLSMKMEVDPNDQLFEALNTGNLAAMQEAIDNGASVNPPPNDPYAYSPLCLLIAPWYGSDVRILSDEKRLAAITLLLNNGALVDQTYCESGRTPLSAAAAVGNVAIINLLLTFIPLDEQEKIRGKITGLAILRFGKPQLVRDMRNLITQQVINDLVEEQMNRIEQLLAIPTPGAGTALEEARAQNETAIVKMLDMSIPASREAVRKQIRNNIMRILFGEPEKPSPSDLPHSSEVIAWRIQIREALRHGDLETASAIIESRRLHPGKEIIEFIHNNNLGIPLALVAAQKDHNLTLKFLKAENLINPKALGAEFQHALQDYFRNFRPGDAHAASSNKINFYLQIASLFDEVLLDPNATDNLGDFLFHDAISTGYVQLIDYWLKHGANPNLSAKNTNETPIYYAAQSLSINTYKIPLIDRLQILEMLLKAKADPNPTLGGKPLTILVEFFSPKASAVEVFRTSALEGLNSAIQLLLEYGADPNQKDAAGKTALDHLQDRGPEFEKIRRMLKKAMAAERTVEEKDPFGSWENE